MQKWEVAGMNTSAICSIMESEERRAKSGERGARSEERDVNKTKENTGTKENKKTRQSTETKDIGANCDNMHLLAGTGIFCRKNAAIVIYPKKTKQNLSG